MEMKQQQFTGNNKLLLGIVLGVITFWLFAQSFTQFSANNSNIHFQVVLVQRVLRLLLRLYLVVCLSLQVQVASPIN